MVNMSGKAKNHQIKYIIIIVYWTERSVPGWMRPGLKRKRIFNRLNRQMFFLRGKNFELINNKIINWCFPFIFASILKENIIIKIQKHNQENKVIANDCFIIFHRNLCRKQWARIGVSKKNPCINERKRVCERMCVCVGGKGGGKSRPIRRAERP